MRRLVRPGISRYMHSEFKFGSESPIQKIWNVQTGIDTDQGTFLYGPRYLGRA